MKDIIMTDFIPQILMVYYKYIFLIYIGIFMAFALCWYWFCIKPIFDKDKIF